MFWNVLQKYQLRQICLAELWHAAWSWGFQIRAEPQCVQCLGIGSSRVQPPCWTRGKWTSQEWFYLDLISWCLSGIPEELRSCIGTALVTVGPHVCRSWVQQQVRQPHRIPQSLAQMDPRAWRVQWSCQCQVHFVTEPCNRLGWEGF